MGYIDAGQSTVLTISGFAEPVLAIGADKHGMAVDLVIEPTNKVLAKPDRFALNQNHPNPFNPTTNISFNLPTASEVNLDVFNISGQRVTTLAKGMIEAGEHSVEWDGRDINGQVVSSGIYFYRITANDFSATKKMILLK
jgi:hypothetical protein